MPTIVLIDIGSETDELMPPELDGVLPTTSCSRAHSSLCIACVDLPFDQILSRCQNYPRRIGVGAKMIWTIFPEYRWEFYARVERITAHGPVQSEMRLGDVVEGDRIIEKSLTLYSQPWLRESPPQYDSKENIIISAEELEDFRFLLQIDRIDYISVAGREIYLCRIFSIVGTRGQELVPGVRFLNPSQLFNDTDLLDIILKLQKRADSMRQAQGAIGASLSDFPPPIPDDISGAFIVDSDLNTPSKYGDALVARLLTASALSSGVSGQITMQLRIGENDASFINRAFESWHRPYQELNLPWQNVIWHENPIFKRLINLISSSNPQKFASANEDFRLLAIDTVEDSRRSGVPVLQMAQLWMAVERLLPFRGETTVQLAIALSALYPSESRIDEFREIKRSYDFRSKVVHGYGFKRDESVYGDIQRLSDTFRYLFTLSLASNMDTDEKLRAAMISHVLSGASSRIEVPRE